MIVLSPDHNDWPDYHNSMLPGAFLLAHYHHRTAVNIEDAGFQIRDCIAYIRKDRVERITVARKPLNGTTLNNVLRYGVGGLNINACRVPGAIEGDPNRFTKTGGATFVKAFGDPPVVRSEGRWPANVMHDGSDVGSAARFSMTVATERDLLQYLITLVSVPSNNNIAIHA